MAREIDWTGIVSDFQCDVICQVDLHRVKGCGVVCGGCDAFVSLINEKQAQQIEANPDNAEDIAQSWIDNPELFDDEPDPEIEEAFKEVK